jgi:hypothetical protein
MSIAKTYHDFFFLRTPNLDKLYMLDWDHPASLGACCGACSAVVHAVQRLHQCSVMAGLKGPPYSANLDPISVSVSLGLLVRS